jgi:hypothetical protein
VSLWKPAVLAVSMLDSSLVTTSASRFHICCAIGRRNASTSSAALEVASNAPQIVLAALAWMLCNMLSVFLMYTLPLMLAFDQIEQAYIICGSAMPSYILRMSVRSTHQLEPRRPLSAVTVFVAFRRMSSTCSFQYSLEFMVSPRYLHVAIVLLVSIRLYALAKWVSWNHTCQ